MYFLFPFFFFFAIITIFAFVIPLQLKSMQQRNLKPYDRTLATLSISCCRALDLDLAETLLDQISIYSHPHVFNAFLAAFDILVSWYAIDPDSLIRTIFFPVASELKLVKKKIGFPHTSGHYVGSWFSISTVIPDSSEKYPEQFRFCVKTNLVMVGRRL